LTDSQCALNAENIWHPNHTHHGSHRHKSILSILGGRYLYRNNSPHWCNVTEVVIGPVDTRVMALHDELGSLTRFVLGLFVSLAIAKTYFANRQEFGVLFGRTLGFSQMVVAWVQPPMVQNSGSNAINAQKLLIRWANAGFRLLVLEVRDKDVDEIGDDMVQRSLLTDLEWSHIKDVPSRATHIYQWINNVLYQLMRAGYIHDTILLQRMHEQVDDMRAANVWGLPSLPVIYTLMITSLVKIHLFVAACHYGCVLRKTCLTHKQYDAEHPWQIHKLPLIQLHFHMFLENFLYQGLLDLLGALYSPNGGMLLGHLPADNFLDFVEQVSKDLLEKNDSLPFALKLD